MSDASMADVLPGAVPDPIEVVAGPDVAGQRTDRFLADAIGTLSRTRVKTLMQDGAVLRNGAALRNPAEAVLPGAIFTVARPALIPATPQPQSIPFPILYED
ncbi:MAG: hypothetical protein ACRYHQ_02855, partial [Janthinobacterium lividum]